MTACKSMVFLRDLNFSSTASPTHSQNITSFMYRIRWASQKTSGRDWVKKATNNTDTNLRGLVLASWAFKEPAPNCVLTDFRSLHAKLSFINVNQNISSKSKKLSKGITNKRRLPAILSTCDYSRPGV